MEVMDVSLDKFYKVLGHEDRRIPENILRKIAIDVCCNLTCVAFSLRQRKDATYTIRLMKQMQKIV